MEKPAYFSEADLKMHYAFGKMIGEKFVYEKQANQKEMAESVALFNWYNSLYKKINDNIMEPLRSGKMDEDDKAMDEKPKAAKPKAKK